MDLIPKTSQDSQSGVFHSTYHASMLRMTLLLHYVRNIFLQTNYKYYGSFHERITVVNLTMCMHANIFGYTLDCNINVLPLT